MGFILEDQNKKYGGMFNLSAEKKFAEVFESEKDAQETADSLNRGDWNFVVLPV